MQTREDVRRSIGQRIEDARKAAHMTLEDCGKIIGKHFSVYQRKEKSGRFHPDELLALSRAFACDIHCITGSAGSADSAETDLSHGRTVAVLALKGRSVDRISSITITESVSTRAYGVAIQDGAMEDLSRRGLWEGDVVVVDPAVQPRSGDIVHAVDPSSGAHVIRRFLPLHPSNPRATGFALISASKAFDDILVSEINADSIRGTVVEVRRDL